jgi:DNA-binding MurR/RpiR family transcriptional regulator
MRATRCQQVTQTGKARQMEAAIAALMSKPTIAEAAEECHISKRTLLRWMKHKGFKKQYDRAREELLAGTINRLRAGGFDAAMRLHKTAKDDKAPLAVSVSASGRLLDLLMDSVAFENLKERLEELERNITK